MNRPDWNMIYPSQRMPVFAENMVATSQPLAAQAGLETLRKGGNAMDAAVATAIALTVVEPTSNGIGSDAFALIWDGSRLHGINASGCSPRNLPHDVYKNITEISRLGWLGVTTPGAVSAWIYISEKYGSLPFNTLFEPAIRYARCGFAVSPQTAHAWASSVNIYKDFHSWMNTFTRDGKSPGVGEIFHLPQHAETLESIAESRGKSFYSGELAEKTDQYAENTGGYLRSEDLKLHQVNEVQDISAEYRDYTVHEMPPNSQGLMALIALRILHYFDLASLPVDSADSLHIQIEAMKLAFADGHRFIADPRFMTVNAEELLGDSYTKGLAKRINLSRATNVDYDTPLPGGTVYLTTADKSGHMVSFIQSNYTGFGSGLVVPGTGISLQNRGACFAVEPGHPNCIAPGKKPYHTIIPAFVMRSGKAVMSLGVMGGYMQPQGHVQVMVRMADYGQNPQSALDAPRWQIHKNNKVTIEKGFSPSTYEELVQRGHDLEIVEQHTVSHGGGQIILKLDNGNYCGASDKRRDGQAVGF